MKSFCIPSLKNIKYLLKYRNVSKNKTIHEGFSVAFKTRQPKKVLFIDIL